VLWNWLSEQAVEILSTAAATNVVLVHGGFVDGSGWQKVLAPRTAFLLLDRDKFHASFAVIDVRLDENHITGGWTGAATGCC
jgi:hypothetical protein